MVPRTASYDSATRPAAALEELAELWRYRDLVGQLVRRDLVARYKRSFLGVLWTMLNPLGTMLILAVVFSRVFGRREDYAVYVLAGLLAWNFISQSTLAAMRQLAAGTALLQRIYVPRTIFAVTAIATALVNLLLSLPPLAGIMLATGVALRPELFFLPLSFLVLAAFSLGAALLLSLLAVYFTDVVELYAVLLPALLYATPIIYPPDILPSELRPWFVSANPLYHLITFFRAPICDGRLPDLASSLVASAVAVATLAGGWFIFTTRVDDLTSRL